MGRPSSPNLPVRGGDSSALSDEEMVVSQGLGNEARQAHWHEQGEGCYRPEDCRNPPLRLGRWNVVRLGPRKVGLIVSCKILVRSTGVLNRAAPLPCLLGASFGQ